MRRLPNLAKYVGKNGSLEPNENRYLPCPSCGQTRMVSFQDTAQEGFWHACAACSACGDGLDLLETQLGVTTYEAVDWLDQQRRFDFRPTQDDVEAYLETYRGRREAANALWLSAKVRMPPDRLYVGNLRRILSPTKVDQTTWERTGGQYLGVARAEDLRKIFPDLHVHVGHPRNVTEYAIQPLYSLPGKISAFRIAVGADNKKNEGWKVVPLFPEDNEQQFLYLDTLSLPEQPRAAIIFLRLADLTELAMRCASEDVSPLPMFAVDPNQRTARAVQEIAADRPLVIWSNDDEPSAFKLAAAIGAKIYRSESLATNLAEVVRRGDGYARWWRKVVSHAVSPASLVSALIRENRHDQVEKCLEGLEDRAAFLRAAKAEILKETGRTEADTIDLLDFANAPFRVDRFSVINREDQWKTIEGDLIFDATIRVNTVFYQRSTKRTWYRGDIRLDRQALPFTATKDEFERDPFGLAVHTAIAAGCRMPVFKTSWKPRALELVMADSKPKTVVVPDHSGWVAEDASFIFGSCRIAVGGTVEPAQLPESLLAEQPGQYLGFPNHYRNDDTAERLLPSMWNILLFVASRLLSPIFDSGPGGLAVCGRGSSAAIRVAEATGCLPVKTTVDRQTAGSWPSLFDLNQIRNKSSFQSPINVIVQAPDNVCDVLAINERWSYLRAGASMSFEPEDLRCASSLVVDFLHFCSKEPALRAVSPKPGLDRTRELFEKFFALRNITLPACRILYGQDAALAALSRTISRLAGTRNFQVNSPGTVSEQTGIVLDEKDAWIGLDPLAKSLAANKINLVSQASITRLLQDKNLLLDRPRPAYGPGWLVPRTWVEESLSRSKSKLKISEAD